MSVITELQTLLPNCVRDSSGMSHSQFSMVNCTSADSRALARPEIEQPFFREEAAQEHQILAFDADLLRHKDYLAVLVPKYCANLLVDISNARLASVPIVDARPCSWTFHTIYRVGTLYGTKPVRRTDLGLPIL